MLTLTLVLTAVVVVSLFAGIGLGEVLWALYRWCAGHGDE